LHYYSPKAYAYIRKAFNLAIPHHSTLYSWVSHLDMKPGFLNVALQFLSDRNKEKKRLYSLSIDEVHLRSQVVNNKGNLNRLSQDGLELLFSELRQRFGCNNNPNPIQLAHALKWMLTVRIDPSLNANCIQQETLVLPTLSSVLYEQAEEEEQDDTIPELPPSQTLSLFVDNIVVYIAG